MQESSDEDSSDGSALTGSGFLLLVLFFTVSQVHFCEAGGHHENMPV